MMFDIDYSKSRMKEKSFEPERAAVKEKDERPINNDFIQSRELPIPNRSDKKEQEDLILP